MTTPTTATVRAATPVRPAGTTPRARVRNLSHADQLRDRDLQRLVAEVSDLARLELSRPSRGRRRLVTPTSEVKALARKLGVSLDSNRTVVQQLDVRKAMPVAAALARRPVPSGSATSAKTPSPRAGAAVSRGARFTVRTVTCGDETDPERIGKDDIALGGIALAADGTTTAIDERFVGKFNDGDKVELDPPLELANLSLRNVTFPSTIGVIVGLAEKDLGGFATFLADAFAQVKDLINGVFAALGGAFGTIIGGKIGAELGGEVGTAVGGPIGAVIGLLAGLVLGAIIGSIVAAARDDIFVPTTTMVTLDAPDATFGDGTDSQDVALQYVGFGGRYTIAGRWTLVR
jgi:hypothetical protein